MITVLNQNLMSGLTQSERLVAEYEVTDSAVTTVTFDGLDLVGDGGVYEIEADLVSNTTDNANVRLYINNDTNHANYASRYVRSSGTSLSTDSPTEPFIGTCYLAVGATAKSNATLSLVNSHAVWHAQTTAANTTYAFLFCVYKSTTDTNITRLDFTCATASGIGVGSKISIYRKQ